MWGMGTWGASGRGLKEALGEGESGSTGSSGDVDVKGSSAVVSERSASGVDTAMGMASSPAPVVAGVGA